MSRKILYLGLEAPAGVTHYPVIRTERIRGKELDEALILWPQFTHVIFTSKTTVRYWFEVKPEFDKVAIAIGDATARELEKWGVQSLIAPEATQEGVIAILDGMEREYLFIPRSKRARSTLSDFLNEKGIRYYPLDLYDTVFQKPGDIKLDDFDEIVFTSPSTVEGFLKIFGAIPKGKIITSIGPVTGERLGRTNLKIV